MRFRSTSAPSQFYILHAALRDVQCCLLISRRSSVALVVNLLVPRARRRPAITLRLRISFGHPTRGSCGPRRARKCSRLCCDSTCICICYKLCYMR